VEHGGNRWTKINDACEFNVDDGFSIASAESRKPDGKNGLDRLLEKGKRILIRREKVLSHFSHSPNP
jgi:hypothetical protein